MLNLKEEHSKFVKLYSFSSGATSPTNIKLVEEMTSHLDEEIFKNPNSKFLDPCAGTGTFGVVLHDILLKYHDSKWIFEKMIFMVDTSRVNCDLLKKLGFVNVYNEDFLNLKLDMKFDVIVGNPPYNNDQKAEGKRGGGSTLWDKFVIKVLNSFLKENGYLVFVHPTLWRKPQSERSTSKDVSELMMKKQIHYLESHDSNDGMKTFNAGTRYDFYVLENCQIYTETLINGEDRKDVKVDLRNYDFIPNYNLELFDKIVAKKGDDRCPILFNRTNYGTDKNWVSDEKNDEFKYTLIHSTPKNGTRYMYSSRNDNGHFGFSKVIFGESGIYDVIIDLEGNYGMSQGAMAICVNSLEEAVNLKKVLMSDKFKFFLKSVLWSNFRIDWRLFSYLKKDFWKEFI